MFRVFDDAIYNEDEQFLIICRNKIGVPKRVGRALAAVNQRTLRRAIKRGETELLPHIEQEPVFALQLRFGRKVRK